MLPGHNWKSIKFNNSPGHNLNGLLLTPGTTKGPVVIVCHGFTGSKEGGGMALAMGEELGQRGYSVLLFDFSGNGESEGLFEQITLSGQIDDLKCAVDWCISASLDPVYTTGRSFGGTTVICHAASDLRVAGVCTWAAPARLKELFTEFADGPVDEKGELYALAGEDGVTYLRKTFFDDLAGYDVQALAGQIAPRPLLIIQGEKDEVVDPADASLIYHGAGQPKELLYIPGADHRFSRHRQVVWNTFFAWLENNQQRHI
ncbi:alpha/beta hydrolase [Desulfoscipio gibsoniae]|uniref:Alpha/beta superfamily hydrolase n=1 Tax=Desulfoscipio gibsoniae DSM 7213 TaxID=767817 RepID=R4KIP7_9FIRM|nr:alpha/beta hydrolase [Desulfoscipio gibsoniae]AGL03068.1 alpha/beta superfamily hydrolase [Desulfoscipio gibsoniae DSM 7213]